MSVEVDAYRKYLESVRNLSGYGLRQTTINVYCGVLRHYLRMSVSKERYLEMYSVGHHIAAFKHYDRMRKGHAA